MSDFATTPCTGGLNMAVPTPIMHADMSIRTKFSDAFAPSPAPKSDASGKMFAIIR